MTPESIALLGALLERYGLPVLILGILGWLLLTRRLTLGSETAYVEERRKEEREGRLVAEKALQEQTAALSKLADSDEVLLGLVERAVELIEETPRARR